ncbi:hypothetical protein NMG60_11026655 [Bertholletia excelsa]
MTSRLGPSSMQLMKTDRSLLSDDNVMMKQILSTHSPDVFEIDVRPILSIVEDILRRSYTGIEGVVPGMEALTAEQVEEKAQQVGVITMLEAISFTIDRIACELSFKSLSGQDGHQTTLSIFNMVSKYPWDAKLVLTLAAFALNYGEFWLLAQIYSSNQLAKSMAILKQVPSIMEHSVLLKPRFDALNALVQVMLDLSWCIVAFNELPMGYITRDAPALTTAQDTIPTAVYWCIRAVIACVAQITSLTSMGHEYVASTMETWELTTLAHKINTILEHLRKQLSICHKLIEDKRHNEAYEALQEIFRMTHIDNMKVLRALIYPRDDIHPLHDGSTKRRVNLEVLRRKNVLLLISTLDISQDELSILEQIYNESRQQATRFESLFEVVWIPIVDRDTPWNEAMQNKFENLQSTMPWYTVHHPSIIDPAVVRFVKEKWQFRNRAILVVLDPQGRVVSPNAIHMMWIWGGNAFPFTSVREEALWREEIWRLELLVDGVDPEVLNWIRDGKYIMLYGGDDIEYIRKLTAEARAVARAENIRLEMVYVGKSTKKDKVRRAITTIESEGLSSTWQDLMIWFFWTRLESMLYSKIQLGKVDELDPMVQEIKKLLSYDREGGWAVLAHGSDVVVNGHGMTVVRTFAGYDPHWKPNVPAKGFDISFRDYHNVLHKEAHPCCRFEFPSATGRIPEAMKCPECFRIMEKYITFLCCHDEGTMGSLF